MAFLVLLGKLKSPGEGHLYIFPYGDVPLDGVSFSGFLLLSFFILTLFINRNNSEFMETCFAIGPAKTTLQSKVFKPTDEQLKAHF